MTKKRASSGMELMLIELISAIVVFALLAAVCVRIFTGSRQISEKSADLGSAVIAAENAAEIFKSAGGDAEKVAAYLNAVLNGEKVTVYYNSDWEQCGREGAAFILTLYSEFNEWDSYTSAVITVEADEGGVFYSLEAAAFSEVAA